MKVVHITNNYPTAQFPIFGIFVKEQIESLTKQGVQNEVFFINGKENGKFEYIQSIIKLHKFLKRNKFDIVHCHHAFSAIVFILSGFSRKIPSVVSFQNDPSDESIFNLFSIIKHFTTSWIFKNNSVLADKVKGYYLPNGVNTDFFKPISRIEACNKLNLDPAKRYILFVSSNFKRKQKRYDRFRLIISELKKWDNSIEELTLINTERTLVPYYFNAASLHLLSSDFEGSPNSVKEALICNIPVVSTNVGNVKELLVNEYGSYCAEGFSIKNITELCKKSLTSNFIPNYRDNLIEKGYDINTVAIKLKNIYINTIKTNEK